MGAIHEMTRINTNAAQVKLSSFGTRKTLDEYFLTALFPQIYLSARKKSLTTANQAEYMFGV